MYEKLKKKVPKNLQAMKIMSTAHFLPCTYYIYAHNSNT